MKSKELSSDGLAPVVDDPFLPSFTIRVLIIGSLWNMLFAIANTIFSFRTTSFEVPPILATLLSYPMGVFLSRIMPKKKINLFGWKFELNEGDFSVKEHLLIYIIATGGSDLPYGMGNVVTQKMTMFMGDASIGVVHAFFWVLSSQLLGLGMVGIMRRFLITPPEMIWPSTLSDVALFVGFHEKGTTEGRPKRTMFWYGLFGMFLYSWFPLYITPILQSLPLLCLFNDARLKFLGSTWPIPTGYGGIGIGSLTFDWSQINSETMTSPWWATLNKSVGNVIWTWIVTPALYYKDGFGMDSSLRFNKLPVLNTGSLFSRNGTAISPSVIYNQTTFDINLKAYNDNAPIYITTFFAMSYGAGFLAFTASFSHVICWYGKDIWRRISALLWKVEDKNDQHDIHNELMKHYTDFSEGAYIEFLFACVILQIIINLVTPFKMPIWSLFLCLFMGFACILPLGIIRAVAGSYPQINIAAQFIIGLLIPGNTVGVMTFKSLATNIVYQSLLFLSQLKLGHYMKINPKHMVYAQLYGTTLGAIFTTSTFFFLLDAMKGLLGTAEWLVSDYSIFYNAAAIWGSIGPQRFFGIGSVYQGLLWCFPLGILLPIILWLLNKSFPESFFRYINIPLLCSMTGPGRVQNNLISTTAVSWFFQNFIRNNYYDWWNNYNYILAIAFSSGVAICDLFVTILEESGHNFPVWYFNPKERESTCKPL